MLLISRDGVHSGTAGRGGTKGSQVQLPSATTSTSTDGKDKEWVLALQQMRTMEARWSWPQSYSFKSTTALDAKARARPAAGDREGPPVSSVNGSCVWRNAGDQCVAARACLCFYGPSKAYLILADFLVPASDWCRLMAASDSLDAPAAHSCS